MSDNNKVEVVEIPVSLMNSILEYIQSRPYAEAFKVMDMIRTTKMEVRTKDLDLKQEA